MSIQRFFSGEKYLYLVRSLIIFELVVMLVSTAVAVGVECLVGVLFILSAELRKRFLHSLKQPMVLMSMLLYGMITIGLFYGLASWEVGVEFWSSWRKLLLVPMTVSVFDEPDWKRKLAVVFAGFSFLAAIVSTVGYLLDVRVYHRFPVGIVLANHATQSMVFALAIFACFVLLRFFPLQARDFWLVIAGLGTMTLNLFFITPGRSGYLAFLVLGMVSIFVSVSGKRRYVILACMPVVVGLFLMVSPVAKQKIMLGLSEIADFEKADQLGAMGFRMVVWKNTLKILRGRDYPILVGFGTGGFKEAYRPQVAGQTGWQAEVVDDSHNQYMRIAVEHGVIGLLIFLGFIAACIKQKVPRPYKFLGIGALLSWCATSLFSGHFGTFVEGRLILIWLGTMLAMPSVVPADTHPVDATE
jgi:O-antigen ligase